MRNRKAVAVLAVLVIAVSLAAIGRATWELPPTLDARIHSEIGRALAQEAIKQLRPGGRITIVTRDTDTFKQPALDIVLSSLSREVGKAGATISAVHPLQVDPLRPVQVPPGDFLDLIHHSGAGDVIVSLMGAPWLNDEQVSRLGSIKPKIVAFCPGTLSDSGDLRPLVERDLLHAAVLARRPNWSSASPIGSRPESFDALYVRVGPAELNQMTATGAQP